MSQHNQNLNAFILGAVFNLLVSIDFVSLLDYSLKAIIGGSIWLCFQLLAERLLKSYSKKKGRKNGDE